MMAEYFDVIIVGYGPTGEVLAAVLGKAGHKVAVVDRWPTLYGMPRLSHIDDETARIIQAVADVDHALRDSCPIDHFTFLNADGELLTEVGSPGIGPAGYANDISIYQPDVDQAIHDAAQQHATISYFLGHDAVALEWDPGGATLDILEGAGSDASKRRLTGRFLVGCDGARSFVRDAIGVTRTDHGFNERWLNIDTRKLRSLDARFDRTIQICDPARGHMHLPIGRHRLRFERAVLPDEASDAFLTPAFAWQWLEQCHGLGSDDVEITRQIVYTFEARIADRWCDGAVFLAGDAAHTMPPYMGQGACSGMRDGLNLGWKLDLVLRGHAHADLLDSYEAERRAHVTAITMMSVGLGRLANEHDAERARVRDEMMRTRPPKKLGLPNLGKGLIADGLPLAGTLWPQGKVRSGDMTGRFDDVVGGGFVFMSLHSLTEALAPDLKQQLSDIGCRFVSLADPGFVDIDGIYEVYFRDNAIVALLARPDFSLFGAARTVAESGVLGERLIAALQPHHDTAEPQPVLAPAGTHRSRAAGCR